MRLIHPRILQWISFMRSYNYLASILIFFIGVACIQQSGHAQMGLDRLMSTGQSAEASAALDKFRASKSQEEMDTQAGKLMEFAEKALEENQSARAADLARHVFLSSANAASRQRAFTVLDKCAPIHLAEHTKEFLVLVPNVSCYGRFQDSLNQSVRDQLDWVYKIDIRNTNRVQQEPPNSGFLIGTIAELRFTVNRDKSPEEFVRALKEKAGGGVGEWEILVPTKVIDLLPSTDKR